MKEKDFYEVVSVIAQFIEKADSEINTEERLETRDEKREKSRRG